MIARLERWFLQGGTAPLTLPPLIRKVLVRSQIVLPFGFLVLVPWASSACAHVLEVRLKVVAYACSVGVGVYFVVLIAVVAGYFD